MYRYVGYKKYKDRIEIRFILEFHLKTKIVFWEKVLPVLEYFLIFRIMKVSHDVTTVGDTITHENTEINFGT